MKPYEHEDGEYQLSERDLILRLFQHIESLEATVSVSAVRIDSVRELLETKLVTLNATAERAHKRIDDIDGRVTALEQRRGNDSYAFLKWFGAAAIAATIVKIAERLL